MIMLQTENPILIETAVFSKIFGFGFCIYYCLKILLNTNILWSELLQEMNKVLCFLTLYLFILNFSGST